MLYVFYGTDAILAREKANLLVQGLQSKHKEAELVRVTEESYNSTNIDTLLATQGLFKSNYIIYLDNLGDVYKEWDSAVYEQMHNSKHLCILLSNKLSVATLREIGDNTNKIIEYKAQKATDKFNIFSISNALKIRDKKKLWVLLIEARLQGVKGEGATGMLFWAVKDMLNKEQYNKWSERELKELALKLAALPHKARRSGISVFNALEELALNI